MGRCSKFALLVAIVFCLPGGVRAGQIYWGAYVDQWWEGADVTFYAHAGKQGSIYHIYENIGGPFQTDLMNDIRSTGYIPMTTFQPWDGNEVDPNFTLAKLIAGTYDSTLRKYARGAKAWSHPFFFRFAHEMNGDWYPWAEGGNRNQPGQYVQAWRHVHDIFVRQGATNATWVWCPNVNFDGSIPLDGLYPGDSYVDWTGFDGYYEQWDTLTRSTYSDLLRIAPNKPIMVGETGYGVKVRPGEQTKAEWLTDVLTNKILVRYPKIQAFVYWNEDIYRVNSSAASVRAFRSGIAGSYYATDSFANLDVSPIPPLTSTTFEAPARGSRAEHQVTPTQSVLQLVKR